MTPKKRTAAPVSSAHGNGPQTKGFDELRAFIETGMRMSHVYQPVMIRTLVEHGGECSAREIARAFLENDLSQIEYYEAITHQMPGRILAKHGVVTREDGSYRLNTSGVLSQDQRTQLIQLCNEKLAAYVDKRGEAVWQHRRQSTDPVPGSLRYKVLKRARFRCELCGTSAEEKALEVDHILPRNRGGANDEDNLQSLCYTCNAQKRDQDDEDFRSMAASYEDRAKECVFCTPEKGRVSRESILAYALRDGYPVTKGHTLIIPRRHVASFFELGQAEINACQRLIQDVRQELVSGDPSISGFNVGINIGQDAGQTIFHCHIHLIPRRAGDVENPSGGVRHVIPGKGRY